MKKLIVAFVVVAVAVMSVSAAMAAEVYKVKKASAPITADGDLKEWAGVAPLELTLPDGGLAKAYMMWDASALYLAVSVADKMQANSAQGSNIWQGDSVQLSLDTKNDKNVGRYNNDDFEFGWALTGTGLQCWAWKLADGVAFDQAAQKYAVVHQNGTTNYEIVLSAAQIAPAVLASGSTFGANVLVNDLDDAGRQYVEWSAGTGSGKNPSMYNDITLVD